MELVSIDISILEEGARPREIVASQNGWKACTKQRLALSFTYTGLSYCGTSLVS